MGALDFEAEDFDIEALGGLDVRHVLDDESELRCDHTEGSCCVRFCLPR